MEKAPDSCQQTQYRIRASNLYYKLSPQARPFNLLRWKEVPATTYILKNVNFEAQPGEVTALAGPSGAGKTTLLDVIAGMIPKNKFRGHVLVNEMPMDATIFRRLSGYLTQDEALFPLLTVEETLMYSARLRLPDGFNRAATRVTELLKELGLDHVANVRIGQQSNRGISSGELRRVSIGVDLVHDPDVILLDEPTSGLDSASALRLALLLKSMAKDQGKTVVLTIHQPGFRILELFDQVTILSNGTVLHHGSLHILEQRLKCSGNHIPQHVNVLEFAIEMAESLAVCANMHS